MSYTNYAAGVQKGNIGQANAEYNFLVSGLSDYTGATGVMIKNDTTLSAVGNKGTRIYQNSDDNSFIDFRTTATDGAKAIAVRLQDDSNPNNFSNMLVLNKDTVTDTSVYGATVGGRVKASQYYVSQADVRAPNLPGVYIGMDNSTVGFFKVNKGTGSGGFTFNTYNANGTLAQNNMNLLAAGNVQVPYYQSTGATQDSETTAFASFDANGNILRDYNQNTRIRSMESRLNALEGETVASVPTKMNEIIGRLNSLKYWSTNIQTLSLPNPPTPFNPSPSTTSSVQVVMGLTVSSSVANGASWQSTFTNTVASTIGVLASQLVISNVAASGSKSTITIVINPDASSISPALAANKIIDYTSNDIAPLYTALQTAFSGTAVVDTTVTPTQSPTAYVSATPVVTQIVANLPINTPVSNQNSQYSTFGIYNNAGYAQIGENLYTFSLTSPTTITRIGTTTSLHYSDYTQYAVNNGTVANLLINNGIAYSFDNGSSPITINLTTQAISMITALYINYRNCLGFDIYDSTMYLALNTEVKTVPMSSIANASLTTLLTGMATGAAKRITVDGTYFYICDTSITSAIIKQYRLSDNGFVQNMVTTSGAIRWMRYKSGYVYYSMNRYIYRVNVSSKVVQVISDHPGLCVPMFDFDSVGNMYYFTQNTGIDNNFYVNDPAFYKVTNL